MNEDKKLFEIEKETYESVKEDLIATANGKYVLIKGKKVIGTFDTFQDAVKVGRLQFPNESVYIKQISAIENVMWFSGFNLAV